MKLCATCQRTFPDSKQYCLEDGTALQHQVIPSDETPVGEEQSPPPLPQRVDTTPQSSAPAAGPADDAQEDAADSNIGKLVGDRYLILSLIGLGGMGVVYRAEQVHLRKVMAIKLLHENLSARKQLISRFTREARAISRLSSPHTVMVYDFGRWEDLFFLVMELLEGESLDAVLEREGPLSAQRSAHIVLQMCDSLAEAHAAGIIHRDLKPDNVMLVRNHAHADFVKILDFGLAKVSGVEDPYTIHSQRDIFGTPYYMSPEQIRAGEIDHRSDVYAVGALLFRMLTGRYVFGAERNTFDILKAHLMEPVPAMAAIAPDTHVPPMLERIVRRALEKDPADRYPSMGELAVALAAAQRADFDEARVELSTAVAAPVAVAVAVAVPVAAPRPAPAASPGEAAEEEDALGRTARQQEQRRNLVFVLVLLGLATALVAALSMGSNGSHGDESEPNDTPRQANVLGPERTARGVIGRRRSPEAGDRDCFRLPPVRADEDLTIRVDGVPTMDLAVTLYGADGEPRHALSHRGVGQGELLRYLDVRTPLQTVCISEQKQPTAIASESLSDQYTLHIETARRPPHCELEPNDTGQGNELRASTALTGSLDGLADTDLFTLEGLVDRRIVRIDLDLQPAYALGDLRIALFDDAGRMLATDPLRAGETHGALVFAAEGDQVPARLELRRPHALPQTEGGLGEVPYTVRYSQSDLAEQTEAEPNDSEATATRLVCGAWTTGAAEDAAGVDWLAVDGGDPSLGHLRIQAVAPPGQAFSLLVRDTGRQVDVRQIQVTDAASQDLRVTGSGEGFLLRMAPLDTVSGRRSKPGPGAHYRVRVRYERETAAPAR